jgi:hypothetical protein
MVIKIFCGAYQVNFGVMELFTIWILELGFWIYTAFHNYVPSHGPPAERVAWILPLSAVKTKARQ